MDWLTFVFWLVRILLIAVGFVVVHELGHYLVARRFGYDARFALYRGNPAVIVRSPRIQYVVLEDDDNIYVEANEFRMVICRHLVIAFSGALTSAIYIALLCLLDIIPIHATLPLLALALCYGYIEGISVVKRMELLDSEAT